jgi:hypothetical protein
LWSFRCEDTKIASARSIAEPTRVGAPKRVCSDQLLVLLDFEWKTDAGSLEILLRGTK